ncbi:MAG TPA: AIR synthase-related protein [Actinomycetota bacterium]|nr:AIR synthase-related protein [Actinomycetota bacterium]
MEGSKASTAPLPPGKLPVRLLDRMLAALPPLPPEVRLGPRVGEDAAAIEVPAGVLVVATDPITLTSRDVGLFAIVINANDVAVTGARPRWFLAAVLLPPGTTAADVEVLFAGMREGLAAAGVALVGGHTEVTPAVSQPVVVGQMLGLAEGGRVVETGGMRPGDGVVQVGPAPIEGAAVLAAEAGERLGGVGAGVVRAALAATSDPGISVVEPALLARDLGATSLHDPTEGGLASGLHEMASASGVGIEVDREAVLWFEPGVAVCRALGADPWATLASGTLLASFPPDRVGEAARTLEVRGHRAAIVGRAVEGEGVRDRAGRPLPWPERDEVARVLST